ncbi:hypothetical protein [Methanolobus profundi]|uniref:Uncharacterized protein n=1 Tax=Methanolobus profundi TaxID=487685 RepID=A0A1I4UML1_9EURY|nr:hypothetical protein [Methanolobus profundi]SFM90222.1 hypothetical protein SAMN04488696_2794 [Methanolobus profundi]
MAKANQCISNVPSEGSTEKKQNAMWKTRALFWLGSCLLVSMAMIGCASASTSINWTEMTDMVDGLATVLPSFGNLIMAAVPIILVLAVVGFATGMFDSILDGISSAFKVFKR